MRGVGIPSQSTLFLTLGGGGRGVGISTPSTLFFTLGLKWGGGRSGNSNSEHSFPHLGVEGGRREWEEETLREEASFITNQA